jgi:hypothetical protein
MSKWRCPDCGGGFPEGPANDGCCPWCGQAIDGSYEPTPARSIVKADTDNEQRDGGPGTSLADIFR